MAEILKAIASSTAKLRELLKDSKRDLHRIRLLLDSLDESLRSLWPFDLPSWPDNTHGRNSDSLLSEPDPSSNNDGSAAVESLAASPPLWEETLAVVASGRAIGIAAEADEALTRVSSAAISEKLWIGDGKSYARWLAQGVVWLVRDNASSVPDSPSREKTAAQLLEKGMAIGYLDDLVNEVTRLAIIQQLTSAGSYCRLIGHLPSVQQRRFLSSLLRYLPKLSLQNAPLGSAPVPKSGASKSFAEQTISGTAALLQSIITTTPNVLPSLIEYLSSQPQNMTIVRAGLAAIPEAARAQVLRKTWSQFSDNLHIQHTPVLTQEANVYVLLLSAGYVHRYDSATFRQLARSSMHNTAISEHLKSSSERVKWLGMCVGMAVSSLVDDAGKRMDFGIEDMQSNESRAIRDLVYVKDAVGKIDELVRPSEISKDRNGKSKKNVSSKVDLVRREKTRDSATKEAKPSAPKIIEIVDDEGEGSEEDDDLVPYAKPDSDDPDSEEDATLVNRDKPKAPAYIRDLITKLSDTSNDASHTLAVQTAATLIRRKATFGSELHDRTEELAQCLVSLQDELDIENWHELRQSALIALVDAEPKIMGPWLARTLFEGDLSTSQRIAVITTIGFGGRELAGFKTEDDGQLSKLDTGTAAKQLQNDEAFPTKKLPGRLHEIYSAHDNEGRKELVPVRRDRDMRLESRKVEALSRKMEQALLRPVSTKEISRPRPRTKMLKNDLASVVADYFFFPLTRYWQVYSQASSRSTQNNPLTEPILASLTLKTLAILLTAAGPATLSLPQLTKELFTLLLSTRPFALRHPPVLESVLFALLTLLDVHTRETMSAETSGMRWLADECGGPLVEFREWVGMVWEKLGGESGPSGYGGLKELKMPGAAAGSASDVPESSGGGGGGDEETQRCRVLAASFLVKAGEIVETYQRLLVGELSGM